MKGRMIWTREEEEAIDDALSFLPSLAFFLVLCVHFVLLLLRQSDTSKVMRPLDKQPLSCKESGRRDTMMH